ncbi:MAG: MGMT family protein [Acidobacteriota bacterium]
MSARRTPHDSGAEASARWERFYTWIRRIPEGRVATYGQIAALAGLPRHARQVGYALAALRDDRPDHETVPWHRVINARGEVSRRSEPGREGLQEAMLRAEGVELREVQDGPPRVPLRHFRWEPDEIED